MKSLFIFRRDLRIPDNTALIACSQASDSVIPAFIFTPEQIEDNKYRSSNAIQFMVEALTDLDGELAKHGSHLAVRYGENISMINALYKKYHFTAIYVTTDYTPYSIKRDSAIAHWCKSKGIKFVSVEDHLLCGSIEAVKTNTGGYYKVYTQFLHKAEVIPVRKSSSKKINNFARVGEELKGVLKKVKKYYVINPSIFNHEYGPAGRRQGLAIMKKINDKKYKETRDYPEIKTTGLSVHNKFGTISIREFYEHCSNKNLIQQLYWRDFYYYVCYHFPEIFNYVHLRHVNKTLKWGNNKKWFRAWTEGKTGFPFIDAGMRQLNKIGYMHNRARMAVGMFVVKDLLIDWKYAERYFSIRLLDIDRCQNTGNWNWVSSFGMDNTPFLRIFNPWTQSSKFDADCVYIKKWIPELANVPNNHIHKWYKYGSLYKVDYPKPIVEHEERYKVFKKWYKSYF